jgi:hypothetical protein
MIDTDKYTGHTERSWEWYEFADGDWILCPLWEDVIATDDWYVDAETGEHIESHIDIWNWDDAILSLQSDCLTGNRDPTQTEDMRCVSSTHRFGKNNADQRLIADAPLILQALIDEQAEVKRLRKQLAKANKFVHSICQHTAPMMMDSEDYIQTRYFAGKGDDEE